MNYAIRTTIVLIFILSLQGLVAQQDKKILLTGIVVTGENLIPVPNTDIVNLSKRTGVATDAEGIFSFYAAGNDTIRFTAVGFKPGYFVVPGDLEKKHYSLVQIMTNDTVYLQETIVFPWKSYDDFGAALITMQPPPTDEDRAKMNLEHAQIYERFLATDMDGSENFKYQTNLLNEKMYYRGQYPPYRIFDVFSWRRFIKGWKNGEYKKKN